jgi:hypothetical protein
MNTRSLISACQEVLGQGRDLLATVSNDEYVRKEQGPYGASIGAHYRHVLDHFLCLLDGLASGEVDYDRRQRSPELESSVDAALRTTSNLIATFEGLPASIVREECTAKYSVGYGGDDPTAVPSNVAREIMFCVGHAIHHYAILRMLCAEMSIQLPCEFGVAPSTLKHRETEAAH